VLLPPPHSFGNFLRERDGSREEEGGGGGAGAQRGREEADQASKDRCDGSRVGFFSFLFLSYLFHCIHLCIFFFGGSVCVKISMGTDPGSPLGNFSIGGRVWENPLPRWGWLWGNEYGRIPSPGGDDYGENLAPIRFVGLSMR
jgi:hypothetical protein